MAGFEHRQVEEIREGSFLRWKDAGHDLAAVPSVYTKVLLVRGPDHAGIGQLAHANQARIGQLHLAIRVFIEQLQNPREMSGQSEVQDEVAPRQQLNSDAGVSC